MGAQLLCQIVLARLLSPADYGVFGVAMIIVTFATFLSEFGGAATLIRNKEISVRDIRGNFTLQVIIGLFVTLGLAAGAPAIAGFLHKPDCIPVLRVLAVNCLLTMLSGVSMRLLARQMRFKVIHAISVGGYLLGYVLIAIPMAYSGAGVWALVAAWVAQTCTALIVSYALIRHSLIPYLSFELMAAQLGFGMQTFVCGILSLGVSSMDRLVVAKFNAPADLGIYTNAYNLASAPISQIVSSLVQVLFSNASKNQSDAPQLQSSYRRSLLLVSTIAMPAFFTLALASREVVFLLYGAKWAAAAQVVTPLAMAMPFYAIYGVSTPAMWVKGRVGMDVAMQAATLVCLVGGLLAVAHLPMVAAAWIVLAAFVARASVGVALTSRLLDGCVNVWRLLAHWAMIGSITLLLQWGTLAAVRHFGWPALVNVGVAGLVLIVTVIAQLSLMSRFGTGESREFSDAAFSKLSTLLRKARTRRTP
jgi:PST family polysaccharide transporter